MIGTASDLIERDSAAAFSLRALAKELDVRPAALYNHVTALDDLLDAVAARFLSGFNVAEATRPWPDWVRATATQLHERMLAHPELTDLILSRAPAVAAGPALLRDFEDHLVAGGLPHPVAHLAWHTVLTTVIGSVRQERARGRTHSDTFEAVLEVAIAGLVATDADHRAVALIAEHLTNPDEPSE